MAESSRVEELRKRYHENPRRFFAPLANEYRKSGFLDRAILLCQKHLGEQPGNMNGLIVYGQALFESGRHEEARGPFGAALEVDSENLIALRYLGDIARLSGDDEEAQKWYGRVLEYDRRNDEVRALFEQVGGVSEPRSGVSARPPAVNALPQGEDVAPLEIVELVDGPSARESPRDVSVDSSAKTVEITPRPLASVKTAEVAARPARRASLLDIDFDFGETASVDAPAAETRSAQTPPAETPRHPTPRAPTPIDVPLETAPLPRRNENARESISGAFPLDAEYPTPESELEGDYMDLGESLLEPEPDQGPAVVGTPVEGLQVADFDVDVAPLPDLEPSEFTTGGATVEPLSELETAEFVVPAADEPIGSIIDFEPSPTVSASETQEFGSVDPKPGTPAPEPEFTVAASDAENPEADAMVPEPDTIGSAGQGVDLPFLDVPDMEPAADEPTFDPTSTVPTPSTAPAIVTETMAELYLEQGFHAEAVEVYRTLIAQDPDDERLKEKLATLERTRASLEFATPTEGLDDVGERAPANAMLAEVSFDDVSSLGTPKTPAGRTPTPRGAPPGQGMPAIGAGEPTSGPTAREFFAAFALRTVGAGSGAGIGADGEAAAAGDSDADGNLDAEEDAGITIGAPAEDPVPPVVEQFSWAVPAAESPLDALFGNEVRDEDQRAANRLAGIGTTSAPSGGSILDTLFSAVPGEIIESPSAAIPRASEKLHFDQFFSSTSTPPEPHTAESGLPSEPESSSPAPSASASAAPEASPSVSAAPEPSPSVSAAPEPSPSVSAAHEPVAPPQQDARESSAAEPAVRPPTDGGGDGDDLDRFHGWLKGLTE